MSAIINEMEQVTEHPFAEEYRQLFIELCNKMSRDEPPFILGIARKAPRLFDLYEDDVISLRKLLQ